MTSLPTISPLSLRCSGTAVLAGSQLSAVPMMIPVLASQIGRCNAKLLSVANPAICPGLLIARPLDVDPPGSNPRSVRVICHVPTV
jgi:hypothetical protein